MRGFGNTAVLDHGGGTTTLYGHLKEIHVKSGDIVAAGSVIGAVGRTGNATTSHLHFELRMEGRSVDPVNLLQRTNEPR
jgi:murein DD-endopeptidase MepM/ murein hydrolase activator NlpD